MRACKIRGKVRECILSIYSSTLSVGMDGWIELLNTHSIISSLIDMDLKTVYFQML